MSEEEIEKMWKELSELRKSQRSRTLTSIRPTVYPSTMTMKFPSKQSIRKKKIKNIFND
jgi:hypothetical protein